jgi:DNA repair protein RecN (Recombination protein N)
MLRSLAIRDFVIVDKLDLEFAPGFTVLTGETGAGKSILIDALATVLGERAEAGLVREGCDKADVAAEFETPKAGALSRYLEENDLAGEDGACLLRRVIEASGRSRAYVNGRPATAQQLKEIGEHLVDIHGQHAHQSLLRPASQRDLLDGYAGCELFAAEVAAAHREWQDVRRRRLALESGAQAIAAEREQLEWQVRELDALGFSAADWEEQQAEQRRLAHAAGLIEAVEFALETLSEGEASALAAVNGASAKLSGLTDYDPALKEVLEVLEPAQIQLQEAVYGLRHYRNRIDLDPRRLQQVEQRLEALHTTARKYRVTPPQLPELLTDASRRLEEIGAGASPEALAKRERETEARYREVAGKLTAERARTARELSQRVTEQMQGLAMAGGRFEAVLKPLAEGSAYGMEQIEFLVAANPGATVRALAKVASGGELSRISLAIQTVTSAVAPVPTLVFDEVDAGIGGRVAEIVGRMLAALGSKHQVMCITHLPQVAAAADHQWQVSKTAAARGVRSEVRELDRAQRVEEIARMLGGVKITETTRKHAAEMLGLKR